MQRKPIKLKNYQSTEVIKTQIVLHYSEMNVDQQREYFNNSDYPQGCAYMIGQEGLVFSFFHPAYYSNHIGGKHYASEIRSIGIILHAEPKVRELRGIEKIQYFTLCQLRALSKLCNDLRKRFKIKGGVYLETKKFDKAVNVQSGIFLHDSFGDIEEFPEKSVLEIKKVLK